VGDLIKDWRRMNVSFTRARAKLIIFGSRKTLQGAPLLKEFFDLVESKGWILRLPPNADTLHPLLNTDAPPPKRGAGDMESGVAKENNTALPDRPQKKLKLKAGVAEEGVLRSRPVLRDLVNEAR
jgi:DNA replication ATP-dependent helicase Dna2